MATYDQHYKTPDLFGEPSPELVSFFADQPRGSVLDVGCGQGRDAIALGRLGFKVTGIDMSSVGLKQLNSVASTEKIEVHGVSGNMFEISDFEAYDYVLFDSMFHFQKKDIDQEKALIRHAIRQCRSGSILVFCLHNTPHIVMQFEHIVKRQSVEPIEDRIFHQTVKFGSHESLTRYRLVCLKKVSP